jgi:hypothetical protein
VTLPLTIAFLVALCVAARADAPAQVRAASASVPDIQAAIAALAGPGVVTVPEGRVEAVGTLRVPVGVSLIGAGMEKTVLFRGPGTKADSSAPVIQIEGPGEAFTRIRGLGVIGMTDPESASWDSGIGVRDATCFRIDNCRLERFGLGGVHVRGLCRGVIDKCVFIDNFKKKINNVGYGVVVMGTGEWRDDLKPGSADSVFIEDCEFIGSRHAVASNAGARYVFRHNHVHGNDNSQAVDAHGPGYGSKHGTQWIEVYGNVIEKPRGGSTAMCLRGGGGVVFGNTIRDYRAGILLTLDFDTKLDWSRPYPIPEQIGDMWCWDNTLNGAPVDPFVPPRSANHIQLDRDFFAKPLPSYAPHTYPHPLTEPRTEP